MTYSEMDLTQLLNCKKDLQELLNKGSSYKAMEQEYKNRIKEINEIIQRKRSMNK